MGSKAIRPTIRHGGFTLLELIVVISVIVALAAIGFPAWGMINNRVKVNATEALVASIATAITTYSTHTWTWQEGATKQMRTYHTFDLNHFKPGTTEDNPDLADFSGKKRFWSIDGYMPSESDTNFYDVNTHLYKTAPTETDPEKTNPPPPYDVNYHLDLMNSGYRGFITMAQPQVKASFINKRGQVLDAWKRPLRIAFAAQVFGTQPYGIWSAGPDGKDCIREKDNYKDDDSVTGVKVIDDIRSWGGDKGGK